MKLFQFTRRSRASRGDENPSLSDNPLLRNDFLSPSGIEGARAELQSANSATNNTQSRGRKKDYRFSYRLMRCIGNVLAVASTLTFLIAVPMITYHAMVYEKARPDFAALYSSGAFVLITLILSMKLIYDHLTNWYMPDVQKYVVRILLMVPIFAVQSWLSLRFRNARIYIDTLRDLYEALVIQSFMYYLMELLGGEDTLVQVLQEKDPHYGIHLGGFKYVIPSWEMGFEFVSFLQLISTYIYIS